jgi:hypothetical protein
MSSSSRAGSNNNSGTAVKPLAGIPEERKLATGLPARIVRDPNSPSPPVAVSTVSIAAELNARPQGFTPIISDAVSTSLSAPPSPIPPAGLTRSGSGSGTTGTMAMLPSHTSSGSGSGVMSDEAKKGLFPIPESQVMTKNGGMASAASSVMSVAPSVRATRAGSGAGDTKASAASVASGGSSGGGDKNWQNLQNLKNLLSAGFITPTEYKERKQQLIDEMTGTTCRTATHTVMGGKTKTKKGTSFMILPCHHNPLYLPMVWRVYRFGFTTDSTKRPT